MKLALRLTDQDWRVHEAKLDIEAPSKAWEIAFDDFYQARLYSRYFSPIAAIASSHDKLGEGFSIVAILMTLVEFLETTYTGQNFNPNRKKATPYEYGLGQSTRIFVSFFLNRAPFSGSITEASAAEIYSSVRCGLLHEARTCGGWRIGVAKSEGCCPLRAIDPVGKIIFRDKFLEEMEAAVVALRTAMLAPDQAGKELRAAFVRKMDGICQP
ncbi:MAG TPA: hypothetical protein DIU09_09290 [Hyphomonadaceae bacterium]|nr:hypothetical protein AEM38_00050 [Hyphomonadaceae bacterium UKL13-1]HCP64770.1 hypothetical protein [Hyphomonadaceae bacterium]